MDPLLRIVVAVLGAGIGATLASPADHVFGALIGAMAALGIAVKRSYASLLHALRAGAEMRPHFRNDLRIGHFVLCLNRFDMCASFHFFESLIQFVLSLTRAKE